MELELKKTKGSLNKRKITLSISAEAYELYHRGKDNEWDTPDLAVKAVENALKEKEQELRKKAG